MDLFYLHALLRFFLKHGRQHGNQQGHCHKIAQTNVLTFKFVIFPLAITPLISGIVHCVIHVLFLDLLQVSFQLS